MHKNPEKQEKKFRSMVSRFHAGGYWDLKNAIKSFSKKQLCDLIIFLQEEKENNFRIFVLTKIF